VPSRKSPPQPRGSAPTRPDQGATSALAKQRFGAHVSTAGGLDNAFHTGARLGCDCVQIFVKNQKQWSANPLTTETISSFKRARRQTQIQPVVAHAGYLINLGSPAGEPWSKSISAVVDELQRCAALDISWLVLHPGAHMGEGIEAGITRVARALDKVHLRTAGIKPKILLETTAGQGTSVGCEIEHLGRILRQIRDPDRVAVCLDTCHLFVAGYDLSDEGEYERTIDLLRREVTIGRIKCVHMNDAKGVCGSRLDRHEHIGKGQLGLSAFRRVVTDRRLARAAKILETPKGTDGRGADYDRVNLRRLRKLACPPKASTARKAPRNRRSSG